MVGSSAVFILALACGQAPSPAAAQAPTTRPASAAVRLDDQSSVNDLLDALDAAGRDLQSLKASVQLEEIDMVTGTPTRRPGEVYLQRTGDEVMFRASFTGVYIERDGKPALRPERIEYLLKNGELIDRDYKKRTQVTRKLPPQEVERDLLKLGEGPFPLPIGQSRADVRAQFEVQEVDPKVPQQNELGVDAAENTRRLRLTPKPKTDLASDFLWLEIDVGLDDGMPRKVITLNATGTMARVTELKVQRNVSIPPEVFELEPIDRSQWNIEYNDLSSPQGN